MYVWNCQYKYIAGGKVNSYNFSKILFDSNQEFKDHYHFGFSNLTLYIYDGELIRSHVKFYAECFWLYYY